jgi:hypothetical protein
MSDARRWWGVATVAVVGAMVAPVVLDRDSFPLSTYPMYSRARPSEVAIVTAVGIDADGGEHRLSLGVIGASDDPLVVAGELRAAIADGRAPQRCADIAARVAPADAVAVEVVTERRDVVAHVRGDPSLRDRTVHARCEVAGS